MDNKNNKSNTVSDTGNKADNENKKDEEDPAIVDNNVAGTLSDPGRNKTHGFTMTKN